MSLTLLVENNPKIEGFYVLNLYTWLGLETVSKSKLTDAIEHIDKQDAKLDLIIVRSVLDKEAAAKKIIQHLEQKKLQIPVVVIGPAVEVTGAFAHVANSMQLKALIQACAKILGITAKEMMSKPVPDFFPIPITFFSQLRRSICKVYSQDPSDATKFTVRIEKLKDYDNAFIDGLINEGLGTLYVDKIFRLEFVNNLTSEFMSVLKDSDLSVDESLTVAEKSVDLLSKKLLHIGIQEETITLAKKNIDHMKKNVKANPKLGKLLERMLKNQQGYLFKHTQILTYVSLHLVKNIDWGTPEQEEKISFISFFHDIALENDAQAQISSAQDLKEANLSPPEKITVERHAQIAAELVSKFPHAPMGSDQIIRQHHGVLNGIGFSDHYGGNVSPVAVVLIVAEEFTRLVLEREGGEMNQKEMMEDMKTEFPSARFQKVLALLEDITF